MTPYKVGQFLVSKHYPSLFYLITEATEQTDSNFVGHYFYKYVVFVWGANWVQEPNEKLDQCFYSFDDHAANFSLVTEVPESIFDLAVTYARKKKLIMYGII